MELNVENCTYLNAEEFNTDLPLPVRLVPFERWVWTELGFWASVLERRSPFVLQPVFVNPAYVERVLKAGNFQDRWLGIDEEITCVCFKSGESIKLRGALLEVVSKLRGEW